MNTLEELWEKLENIDEITLLEQLEITSIDIVERFKDKIEEKIEFFQADFQEDEEEY